MWSQMIASTPYYSSFCIRNLEGVVIKNMKVLKPQFLRNLDLPWSSSTSHLTVVVKDRNTKVQVCRWLNLHEVCGTDKRGSQFQFPSWASATCESCSSLFAKGVVPPQLQCTCMSWVTSRSGRRGVSSMAVSKTSSHPSQTSLKSFGLSNQKIFHSHQGQTQILGNTCVVAHLS